ncbi:MAG: transporter [Gammaproteobacteria bacterium]|nr:transporter [Gammaproteobacteria bacterium]MBV9696099.1 transporter [Gammaproteobacteria bacterium]
MRMSETRPARRRRWALVLALLPLAGLAAERESRDEAWWTGPMLAPSAATLPEGHVLLEPYLFDVMTDAGFDAAGRRRARPTDHDFGSLTYLLYGLRPGLTVGVIPRFFHDVPPQGAASPGIDAGDLTLQAGYGLLQYDEARGIPALAFIVQETLPTGRYEHLSAASRGTGGGAYATTLALYSQDYFWLPTGRILRTRLDLAYTHALGTRLHDQSVYGTDYGFAGRAYPGDTLNVDLAGEYSLTRHWVLALDLVYQYNARTWVRGHTGTASFAASSGSGYWAGIAPAIEYNLSARVGVLLGVRILEWGRNASGSVTPALALNMVF